MDCQEAIERLPWWLNGSLESVERREVEEHLRGCASCRQALGETRLAWEIYGQHIPGEALVAYAYDERPQGIDPALLERHLAGCPQCAAELELVRASRLLGEHDEVAVMPRRSAPGRQPRPERGWRAAALAAGLTGLIAIGGWVTSREQVRQLERVAAAGKTETVLPGGRQPGRPAAGTAAAGVSTLFVDLSTVTRSEAEGPAQIPASAGHATLILHPSSADVYHEHTFEIRNGGGHVAAPESRLLRNPDNFYSVDVDLQFLPPGGYTIQTFGTDGGAHAPLDRFPFTVIAR